MYPDFGSEFPKVYPEGGLTPDRPTNYINGAAQFVDVWKKNISELPGEIKDALLKEYPTQSIEEILNETKSSELIQKIVKIVQKSSWVFHEGVDGSIMLIPRALHESVRHMGGVSLVKYFKQEYGVQNFNELIDPAKKGFRLDFNAA